MPQIRRIRVKRRKYIILKTGFNQDDAETRKLGYSFVPAMYDNVFISYAKEDSNHAEALFKFLQEQGFKPWMDRHKLLPGHRWEHEIITALRKADFVILILSNTSVRKRGYVQKEFKLALDYCQSKPDSDIYIIPVKVDDCELPESLLRFQWILLDHPDSFYSILEALKHQRKQLLLDSKITVPNENSIECSEETKFYSLNSKPDFVAEIVYPKFSPESEDLMELNAITKASILHTVIAMRKHHLQDTVRHAQEIIEEGRETEEGIGYYFMDTTLDVSFTVRIIRKALVSFTIIKSNYNTGAAHGYYATGGYAYKLSPFYPLEIEDIIDGTKENLKCLRDAVEEKIFERAKNEGYENPRDIYIFEVGLKEEWDEFKNFYLTASSIGFIYNPYHLTPYGYGDLIVEVPYDHLINNLPESTKIKATVALI